MAPMLSHEENTLLTQTNPGTPMGDYFRRYWLPALLASELPAPDCPPVRIRLLGEDLIAFRDTNGRVGLLDEFCPHRRASLFWGRNEECGLRCVYHGWKFEVSGACVDIPNEPPEYAFEAKVRTTAYPTCEYGGIVWAYMGPPQHAPELPKLEWARVPEGHRYVSKRFQQTNYRRRWNRLQPFEFSSRQCGSISPDSFLSRESQDQHESPREIPSPRQGAAIYRHENRLRHADRRAA
jgi:nitrite reductase/ring-hydroxylating ferredoxin subunit